LHEELTVALKMSEDSIERLVQAGGKVRERGGQDRPLRPIEMPQSAPVTNHVTVDVSEIANAMREQAESMQASVDEALRAAAELMARAVATAKTQTQDRPAPIKSATATVIATDAIGNPTKIRFDFQR
jgi:hypothetical protein